MLCFMIQLINEDSYVFRGDRVPSEREADSFFRKTIHGKEAVA